MKSFLTFFLLAFMTTSTQGFCQTVELFDNMAEDDTPDAVLPENETAVPEENAPTGYLDSYIDDVETEKKAQSSARALLAKKPTILNLRQNEIKSLKKLKEKTQDVQTAAEAISDKKQTAEESPEIRRQKIIRNLTAAPLGLYWAASLEETRELGFELQPAERKDYQNVYLVTNPQQKNNTFQKITAIFGIQNKLWCIFAEGKPLDDDARADKVLTLYRRYYQALEKKYGNAEEFFTPYSYEEELQEGNTSQKIRKENPVGGNNFLKELQEGKATLYATFYNDKIGVTLGVSVNGDGKSYISIDYKDFALKDSEQQAVLTKTIEDL